MRPLVVLLAATALVAACNSETPTAVFTGAVNETVNVSVTGYAAFYVAYDGGVGLDPTVLVITPSEGYPAGFGYGTSVIFSGPTLQTGTFTEANVAFAASQVTTDGGPGWIQAYHANYPFPQGTFSLTISSVGPQSTVDGGPNASPTQWASPHGQFTATMEALAPDDAGPFPGPVTVNVTF